MLTVILLNLADMINSLDKIAFELEQSVVGAVSATLRDLKTEIFIAREKISNGLGNEEAPWW